MPLMESDAKRSSKISTESEKVLVSTSAPSSSGSKGLKEFFRRRQKSTGSSPFGVDSAAGDGGFSQDPSKLESSVEPQKSRSRDEAACASSYGNYLTISGTGANALRDLFNRKYRSSARSTYAVQDGEPSKLGSRKGVQGQTPLFRFRSKKDSIKEEERSPSPEGEGSSNRSETKGVKARARHISGPMSSLYGTSLDCDAKFRQSLRYGSSSTAPGARMRTFFDSFRQRSRTVSQDSCGDENVGSQFDDYKQSGKLSSSKKKKFKVTPAFQGPTNRKDNQHIGPDEFIQLYRNRANSDPKPEAILDEAGNVHSCLMPTSPSASKANMIHSYEPLQFVIWRDQKRGTRLFRLPKKRCAETFELDDYATGGSNELVYARFMSSHLCYEVMPSSSKLVIFDTQLGVKKAFFALIQNGVRSVPLWDTKQQDFVGMLTITDFIQILQRYYKSPQERMEELEEHIISTWKEVLHGYDRPMVIIGPDDTLLDAIRSLCDNKVHRLLVVDRETGNALHILTLKRILRFLLSYMGGLQHPEFMQQTLQELRIGSYDNVASASPETPLIEALNMFVERRISALPIVNSDGKVVDIYAKFDILGLAAEKVYYNLDVTITEALKNRREEFEGVMTCLMSERLLDVVERIVNLGVHRLVVVDENRFLKGIISLSDIVRYLVLRPVELQRNRIAEREQEKARRRREAAERDEPDFEGLDLMLQSGSAVGPDLLLSPNLLEITEEPKLSPEESINGKDFGERLAKPDDQREILSEITDAVDPKIPNGSES